MDVARPLFVFLNGPSVKSLSFFLLVKESWLISPPSFLPSYFWTASTSAGFAPSLPQTRPLRMAVPPPLLSPPPPLRVASLPHFSRSTHDDEMFFFPFSTISGARIFPSPWRERAPGMSWR